MQKHILEIIGLNKKFKDKILFKDFNMSVGFGEYVVIRGRSGSGKSTLLNMIGLLEQRDAGAINIYDEKNIKPYSSKSRKLLRDKIGYLFQNFALVEDEDVHYNLKLVCDGLKMKDIDNKIIVALEKVGLKGFEKKKIYECSGGEQQRIAIARLYLKPCELILADEPTGSLDGKSKENIFQLLRELNKEGKTLIIVTHDEEFMREASRSIYLE